MLLRVQGSCSAACWSVIGRRGVALPDSPNTPNAGLMGSISLLPVMYATRASLDGLPAAANTFPQHEPPSVDDGDSEVVMRRPPVTVKRRSIVIKGGHIFPGGRAAMSSQQAAATSSLDGSDLSESDPVAAVGDALEPAAAAGWLPCLDALEPAAAAGWLPCLDALEPAAAAGWLPCLDAFEPAAAERLPRLDSLMRLVREDGDPLWASLVDLHVPKIPSAAPPSSGSSRGCGSYSDGRDC